MTDTKPKMFVFVLMPFDSPFKDTYNFGIKLACETVGAYCERIDEQIFTGSILDRLYNQIAKADVIIAEMTGRNANVFYETGYAHALNKRVILLTKDAGDIPFDLQHYPHIIYGDSITTLKSNLEIKLRWCLENLDESSNETAASLQFFMNGMSLMSHPLLAPNRYGHALLKLDIHNPTSRVFDETSFNLALITDEELGFETGSYYPVISKSKMPSGHFIYNLTHKNLIFPGGWGSLEVEFWFKVRNTTSKEIILGCYTELGPTEYKFTLAGVPKPEP